MTRYACSVDANRVSDVVPGSTKTWGELIASVAELIGQRNALRDALRGLLADHPDHWMWCHAMRADMFKACGECSGCLAWRAAQDALAACEEVAK